VQYSRLCLAALAALALNACGGSGDPAPPPNNFRVAASDGITTLTWDADPGVEYWVFSSTDASLNTQNWLLLGEPRLFRPVTPPLVLCSLINGKTNYYTVNGRTGGGPGGPGAPTTAGMPRAAGSAWAGGSGLSGNLLGVGYAPIFICGPAQAASGIFVAVGAAGVIFTSADGRTWTARAAPAGFTSDLFAVAAFTASLNTPAAPNSRYVAVGAGGAALTSTDGINWTVGIAFNAANPAFRAVAVSGSTFVAVGDNGTVQTTTDGTSWTARTSTTTANLTAVSCAIGRCIALGAGGIIVTSDDNGGTWTQRAAIAGAPALKALVFGNFNANADNTGLVNIATWIAVGDGGVAARSFDNGVTWITQTIGGAGNLIGIGYTTRFVALDVTGNAFTSNTGESWSAPIAIGSVNLRAMVGSGFGYVAAGDAGATSSSF